jgi:octaprenyl-diphosphate synthase
MTALHTTANAAIETVDDVRALVEDDMHAVNDCIRKALYSEVVLINQISHYIIGSGGKRLRPILALLSARAYGYSGDAHVKLAAIIEFIHTATLLHDDVVDASALRRGKETVNVVWGNEASVLVGDFLYSRAFQMMVEVGSMRALEIFSETTNVIAEGEVLQLLNCHEPDTTEAQYLDVIRSKTAKLFEAATRLGPVLLGLPKAQEAPMAAFGAHLGTAFQLVDDMLDYHGSADDIGKNVGDDLAEGKPTLPLIHAIRHGNAEQQQLVRHAIETGGREQIDQIITAVESTGAIAYTSRAAEREAERALEALGGIPDSPYAQALRVLARFSCDRTH